MTLTSHLIELFPLDPVFIFFLVDLLQSIVCLLLFLCFVQVLLFEKGVQGIPFLGSLSQVHRGLEVINLLQLFLQLFLIFL